MNAISPERTVGELVAERPARSRVFEGYRIDYCCGGKLALSEACAKKRVPVDDVVRQLQEADAVTQDGSADFASMPLDALADHIVATHHAYLAQELPRLEAMSAKVARVHGHHDERLLDLAVVVQGLAEELNSHMMKEERILFPVIRHLAQSDSLPYMPFGSLRNPIAAMESEHDTAGNGLESMSTLTDDYTPPEWACNTYRALLDGLRELEQDLHQHIHKENNILFPKAIALEDSRR